MRKITEQAMQAFNNNEAFSKDNTQVVIQGSMTILKLHGSDIACKTDDVGTTFSLCGWNTPTTRERLQAAGVNICQRKGQAYYMKSRDELIPIDDNQSYLKENM